jgi:two-component system response regulator FixJ
MNPEQTVFIVDDDAAIRRSLRFLLESVGLKAETYSSAEEFLKSYNPNRSGCLILDVRMPGMNGLSLQEQLLTRRIDLPVIIITAYAEVPMAVRALKKGAVDFIEKPFSDQLLMERVLNALELDRQRRAAAAERESAVARLAQLTAREREVMDGVVAGKSNKAMAIDLGIAEKTVEAHRSTMMHKLGIDSVADLIRLALACTKQ